MSLRYTACCFCSTTATRDAASCDPCPLSCDRVHDRRHDPRGAGAVRRYVGGSMSGSRHVTSHHTPAPYTPRPAAAARCAAPRKRHPYWMRDGRYPAASVLHALSRSTLLHHLSALPLTPVSALETANEMSSNNEQLHPVPRTRAGARAASINQPNTARPKGTPGAPPRSPRAGCARCPARSEHPWRVHMTHAALKNRHDAPGAQTLATERI